MKLLSDITLEAGGHINADTGLCAMEAVAWYMDELHSDRPQCVSPAIAAAMRVFNDWLPDNDRDQVLKPLLLEVIGTRTNIDDEVTRAKIASEYAQKFSAIAAKSAEWAAEWAAKSAEWAKSAAKSAESAAKSAKSAAESAAWAAESAAWAAKSAAKSAESDTYPLIGQMIMDMCKVGK